MGRRQLSKDQRRLLTRLTTDGPLVIDIDYRPYDDLWTFGFIERHAPLRFRITDKGRVAIATPTPSEQEHTP